MRTIVKDRELAKLWGGPRANQSSQLLKAHVTFLSLPYESLGFGKPARGRFKFRNVASQVLDD
jgi:hypothetical protein